jgi:hypothetical protein
MHVGLGLIQQHGIVLPIALALRRQDAEQTRYRERAESVARELAQKDTGHVRTSRRSRVSLDPAKNVPEVLKNDEVTRRLTAMVILFAGLAVILAESALHRARRKSA